MMLPKTMIWPTNVEFRVQPKSCAEECGNEDQVLEEADGGDL